MYDSGTQAMALLQLSTVLGKDGNQEYEKHKMLALLSFRSTRTTQWPLDIKKLGLQEAYNHPPIQGSLPFTGPSCVCGRI